MDNPIDMIAAYNRRKKSEFGDNEPGILCRIGWHDWTRWEVVSIFEIVKYSKLLGQNVLKGIEQHQHRTCKKCGITHIHTTSTD